MLIDVLPVSKKEELNLELEKMLINISVGLNQWFSKFEKDGNANEPVEIKLQRSGFNYVG